MSTRWMDGTAGQAVVKRAEPGMWDRAFAATAPRPGRDIVSVLHRVHAREELRSEMLAGGLDRMLAALRVLHDPDLADRAKVERTLRVLTTGCAR
jgi:hypothetical protein